MLSIVINCKDKDTSLEPNLRILKLYAPGPKNHALVTLGKERTISLTGINAIKLSFNDEI
jgi:hypothetical protein